MLIRHDADNTVRWKPGERLNHYFEVTCDRLPADHVAVIAEDATYTFRELDNRANQAARYLMDQGIKPGDRVGLLFDKSSNQHIALLGVLKAGAAYVPLDASFPSERVSFILEDAQVDTIVSVSRFEDKLAEFNATPIFLDRATQEIDAKSTDRVTEEEAPLADEQLFYIIYTSGTTGKPKGVAIDHSGICNFCVVAGETYRITEEDRCYQGITLAFDFHVEDLWMPLIAGATLISGKSDANLFGEDLHDYLQHHRITVFPCVPTLWATVEADLDDIRVIILSGEEVPHHLVVKWHREGRYILNAYGPTECSVSSTIRFLTPDIPVTIGTPLPTYTVVILDVDKPELIEEGGTGEIGIAGIALARGYLNREELTAKTFIPDFIGLDNNPSGRIYRTGDLGRINEDGEIEFLGRIDTQVKIRGYRVELGEIEAVLMKVPQIAQAVVNPWSPEQGATDLVAYYTKKPDAGDIDPAEIADTLRSHLPGYMVPSYMEELDQIPMTPNNKADRKNLPEPQGSRFVVAGGEIVAPRTDTEQQVADALTAIMGLEEVSVVDNFFQDMGAHSLLMAQFGTELRNRMNVSAVSIRDIYLNPTIEQLAAYLESLSHQTPGSVESDLAPEPFHIPSAFAYWTCGALQALWFLGWSVAGFWIFVESIKWTYAAMPDLGATYVRILVVALAVAIFFSLLPIVAKWLFIGKWKREAIPIWSLRYFRFWAIKNLVNSAPMARFGDPFYNLYLRLLGAKVGKNAVLHITNVPVCTDLISFGDNAVVAKDALLSGYKAQNNYIRIGPVHVGANAVVSEAAVLDIDTVMEDNTQLGIASSLQAGQTVAEGKHYHGTPGQETSADYCVIEPMPCSTLRRWAYPGIILTAGFTAAPLAVLLLYYLWPWIYEFLGGATFAFEATKDDYATLAWNTGWISFAVFFAFLVLGLLYIGTVPRLLNMFLEKDRTYVLYGFHYFIHELIAATSNSAFYNRLFGDSSAIVYYARWVGYEMNKIIQSGSNFGMSQKHDNPFLCDIGSGTMVSGGLKMVNETMSSSSFQLGQVKIGDHNYLGNYLHIPAGAKIGDNLLLGTKMLIPIDGPVRENVGLLGSPAFEIPRAAQRDLEMRQMDEETRLRQLKAKNRYNLVTGILYLLNAWFLSFILGFLSVLAVLFYARYGMAAVLTYGAVNFTVLVLWLWFVERLALHFGRLEPRIVPVLHEYFWFHERMWKMSGLWSIANAFAGTPFKNIISRMEGARMGKMVFDDGTDFDEPSLITVGDYANLNDHSAVQPHSLEEGVFKSDYVKIGLGCTLGVGSNVHYDVRMEDCVVLEPNAFMMKGEFADPATVWEGNPARSVGDRVVETTEEATPVEAFAA